MQIFMYLLVNSYMYPQERSLYFPWKQYFNFYSSYWIQFLSRMFPKKVTFAIKYFGLLFAFAITN